MGPAELDPDPMDKLIADIVGEKPDQVSEDFSVVFADSSLEKALLFADRARIYEEKKETLLDSSVKVYFYSKESQKQISTLTADSVLIDDKTKNMKAMGNVIVVSDSTNTTITTTVLNWLNKERKLTSDKYVKIVSPEQEIEGIGFESDEKLQNYTIYKVKGVRYK